MGFPMSSEYRDRLTHWIRTLESDLYHELDGIRFEGFCTMAHLSPEEAAKGDFRPIAEGTEWGHLWEYMWLRAKITVAPGGEGQKLVMNLNPSGESTLFVNGRAFGTRRAEWVKVPHHYFEDQVLTSCARAGETFDLLLEVYSGHYYPDAGAVATGPVLPGSFEDPAVDGKRAKVGHSGYGVFCEEAYQLLMDVRTLDSLSRVIDPDSLRAEKIAQALEQFTLTVDFEQPYEDRVRDYRAGREALTDVLSAVNGSTSPRMYAIGNSHLDLAWLWPMQETHRKTARTFAQQLRLLDMYPDYVYLQSQPASYEMCRQYYPELYARIKEAVKQGRWIADGAMYVEPDTNMASGEALIRQILIGKRFYREEFGVDSRMLWLPDTFGYTAALPQILKKTGVRYLVTQKIFWSYNEGAQFPYHYFTWRGMDGSEVTSFLPTSYTYDTTPEELCGVWKSRVQKRGLDSFLIPFGYGDGGGGPCRDHIEFLERQKNLEGAPRVTMCAPTRLFEDLEKEGGPENTWDGELYFSAHRGTYTVQADIKKNNRLSEIALRETELWSAMAAVTKGTAYPAQALDRLWRQLLLHQFHDILPGSSIGRVYKEANAAHAALQAEAGKLAEDARGAMQAGEGLTLFNSLSFARKALLELPAAYAQGARTAEGEDVPVLDGQAVVEVPAMGTLSLRPAGCPAPAPSVTAKLTETGAVLESAALRVTLNRRGEILSCVRKQSGREMARGVMNRMELFKDVPRKFDAWDIDSNYVSLPVPLPEEAVMTVERAQGLSASVRVTRMIGHSTLEQVISLSGADELVRFDTTVQWKELHRLLKVAFTGDVRATAAKHEMQFGFVERPTHRSSDFEKDRFEVCNHRYTALCDESHGFAVLNTCKYGVSCEGSTIALTLLRAGAAPDMRTDNHEHRFVYALSCWEGSWGACRVPQEGMELNMPLTQAAGFAPARSLMQVDSGHVIVDTVKLAEDGSGDLIVRLYESRRADTFFTLRTDFPWTKAVLCDMLENEEQALDARDGVIPLHAGAFEILTLRLKR